MRKKRPTLVFKNDAIFLPETVSNKLLKAHEYCKISDGKRVTVYTIVSPSTWIIVVEAKKSAEMVTSRPPSINTPNFRSAKSNLMGKVTYCFWWAPRRPLPVHWGQHCSFVGHRSSTQTSANISEKKRIRSIKNVGHLGIHSEFCVGFSSTRLLVILLGHELLRGSTGAK